MRPRLSLHRLSLRVPAHYAAIALLVIARARDSVQIAPKYPWSAGLYESPSHHIHGCRRKNRSALQSDIQSCCATAKSKPCDFAPCSHHKRNPVRLRLALAVPRHLADDKTLNHSGSRPNSYLSQVQSSKIIKLCSKKRNWPENADLQTVDFGDGSIFISHLSGCHMDSWTESSFFDSSCFMNRANLSVRDREDFEIQ